MEETRELKNVKYGPFFEGGAFKEFRAYLQDGVFVGRKAKRKEREIYFFRDGISNAIVNLKTRTVYINMINKNALSELAFQVPLGIPRELILKQKIKIA